MSIYRENKSHGLYNRVYTSFTAQTNTKTKLSIAKNKSHLFKNSDFKVEDKAWRSYTIQFVLCVVFQIIVHIYGNKGGNGQKK